MGIIRNLNHLRQRFAMLLDGKLVWNHFMMAYQVQKR